MYKVASKKAQRKAEKISMRDMPSEEERLDPEYRIGMLKDELRRVDAEIMQTHPKSSERKQLGARKRILSDEIVALRGAKKKSPGLAPVFMEVANRILPRETYQSLLVEAQHVYDLRHGGKP